MVTTKLNLSMTEPQVRQIYAKQGDTGRVLDISLDQTPEDGTLRILRPDGVEVTSEAVTGGEISESGETVTFESMTEADVTELTVGIEPVQDLNGYDKPWVGGAGKNKLPYPYGDGASKTTNGITYTVNSDGSVTANGTATADNVFYLISGGTSALANKGIASGTYILNGAPSASTSSNYYIQLQYNGSFVSAYESGTTFTYNASGGGGDMLRIYVKSGAVLNNVKFYPMIRLSSETDPTFAPYSNICPITGHDEVRVYFGAEQGTADETYTTSLGQTVYGGTLDMVTGVLTVDRAIVDLGTLTWIRESIGDGNRFRTPLAGAEVADYPSHITALCSAYPLIEVGQTATKKQGFTIASNSNVYIYDGAQQSATGTDFKTAVTGTQLVYGLASPLTYTLTPQQIKTLVGTNNVWASSGDIVSIKFTYGGLLSELPSDATSVVGKCYCDVEQNGVSSMPFTLNVKKNERAT